MTILHKPHKRPLGLNDPLLHMDHARPNTRRDFLRQGFINGTGLAMTGGVFSLFTNPNAAYAISNISGDLQSLAADTGCSIGGISGTPKLPFICFDLAGGANIAGSNVLVGAGLDDGQTTNISTSGFSKMGVPGDMVPGLSDPANVGNMRNLSDDDAPYVNSDLGLKFHADSAMLLGILERFTLATGNIDGTVIAARSDNDTGNNTHNPLYGIAAAGAEGGVVQLIGSRNSESGGNSMAPPGLIIPELRPTKVDRPSDVTGMVDVGNLTSVLSSPEDVTAVMEAMARISHKKLKLGTVAPAISVSKDEVIKDLVRCGYIKAADIAERFAGEEVDPGEDKKIVGSEPNSIFTRTEFENDREFRKTASVMKMVLDGHAGAGCITMGGYDYHTGDRSTGENRDLRVGRCIGACLNYAQQIEKPVMIYVFSDGSVASNGAIDTSEDDIDATTGKANSLGGHDKGQWTGDNSSTACSFFLVFDPTGNISVLDNGRDPEAHRQIGRFSTTGSVVTSSSRAANNVNALVDTVIANYMSLNGNLNEFLTKFPNHGLGPDYQKVVSFAAIPPPTPPAST